MAELLTTSSPLVIALACLVLFLLAFSAGMGWIGAAKLWARLSR